MVTLLGEFHGISRYYSIILKIILIINMFGLEFDLGNLLQFVNKDYRVVGMHPS